MVQNGLYAISHVWPSGSEKYPEYPPQKAFCGSFTTVAPWFFSRGEFWGRDIKFLLTKRSKSDASQSGTSSSLVKPFFSPSLCARSSNRQKSFRCASSIFSRSGPLQFKSGVSTNLAGMEVIPLPGGSALRSKL